jgi:hypothetical protein
MDIGNRQPGIYLRLLLFCFEKIHQRRFIKSDFRWVLRVVTVNQL